MSVNATTISVLNPQVEGLLYSHFPCDSGVLIVAGYLGAKGTTEVFLDSELSRIKAVTYKQLHEYRAKYFHFCAMKISFQDVVQRCPNVDEVTVCCDQNFRDADLQLLVKYFPLVKTLTLKDLSITHIAPLSSLEKLQKLILCNVPIGNPTSLANLRHIVELEICQVSATTIHAFPPKLRILLFRGPMEFTGLAPTVKVKIKA